MPLYPIKFRPGLDSVKTQTLNQGGWSAAENVRFFNGLPQKDSGFTNFTTVLDIPRSMKAWRALSGFYYLGIAGDKFLTVFTAGTIHDITPLTISDSIAISFSTTAASAVITVTDGVNTPSVGEAFEIVNPIAVGGIILLGTYIVTGTGVGIYTFNAAQKAVTSVMNGGTARQFTAIDDDNNITVSLTNHLLVTGQVTNVPVATTVGGITLLGNYLITRISADQYTIHAADTPSVTQTVNENSNQVGLVFFNPVSGGSSNSIPTTITSCDNWGEFLLSCTYMGPVNVWMPATGVSTPASVVATAPLINSFIFVATQVQQLVCCGTINASSGEYDPMLLRWSDTGDYTNFTPGVANAAGSFRLSIGSQITAGIAMVGQNLIWTDLTVYSMQYLGQPLIWGFQPLGQNCGCVGPHAVGMLAGTPYWMGQNQFFMQGGDGPQMVECTVWDQVFLNLDRANLQNVVCETDAYYGEVGWSVPQTNGTFVFVRLRPDPLTGPAWTASTYHHHTAWVDQNVFGAPIGGHESGLIDQHDSGVDAVGDALPTSLTSGMILLSEGSETIFVRDFLPDLNWLGTTGTLNFTFKFYDYPESTPRLSGPFAVTPSTDVIHPRGRARAMQIVIEGSDLGSNWRLGDCRYRGQSDGRR